MATGGKYRRWQKLGIFYDYILIIQQKIRFVNHFSSLLLMRFLEMRYTPEPATIMPPIR